MQIQIKYFASIRETVGHSAEILALAADQATIASALITLKSLSSSHAQALSHPRLTAALNQSVAPFDSPLKHGDELAFFPPVTGG